MTAMAKQSFCSCQQLKYQQTTVWLITGAWGSELRFALTDAQCPLFSAWLRPGPTLPVCEGVPLPLAPWSGKLWCRWTHRAMAHTLDVWNQCVWEVLALSGWVYHPNKPQQNKTPPSMVVPHFSHTPTSFPLSWHDLMNGAAPGERKFAHFEIVM